MFKSITQISILALVGAHFAFSTAHAATLPQDEQVTLQAAMQRHIDSVSIDGAVLSMDAATGTVVEYFPAKAHPKIMLMGDKVVMCADFVDSAGQVLMANFYMAKRDGDYVVFQTTFGPDMALEKLMKNGKVEMAN